MRCLLALALLGLAACKGDDARPNVLLITMDTTRADYVSSIGDREGTTPSLDKLADEGVLFTRTQSTSATTPISHASILTGLNNYKHGVRVISAKSGFKLPDDVPTLASVLEAREYRTAAIHSAFPVSATFGFQRGFEDFVSFDAKMRKKGDSEFEGWDTSTHQRRSDETTDLVLEWLANPSSEPFFLWIHYWDPHDPIRVPPQHFLRKDLPRSARGIVNPASDEFYAEEVRFMDLHIGRVFDALREKGLWKNTAVCVTSDHGQGLTDGRELHGWHAHRVLYKQQIHVPLILKLPGVAGGKRVDSLTRTIDVFPTLLEYLDIGAPGPVEGTSLLPLIEGRPDEPRIAYADQINGYDTNAQMIEKRPKADFLYCVMDDDWKLIYRPTRPEQSELFHTQEDPLETTNLWDVAIDQRKRLLTELALRDGWVDRPFPDSGEAMSDEAMSALGGLGYTAAGDLSGATWAWRCIECDSVQNERGECHACDGLTVLVATKL